MIQVNKETLRTNRKKVFAGRDVAAVPGVIIHAIAAGRKAASSIDKELGGTGEIGEILFARENLNQYFGRDEQFATWPREKMPELRIEERHKGFREVALGYDESQNVKEAKRCLQCDIRLFLGDANPSDFIQINDALQSFYNAFLP